MKLLVGLPIPMLVTAAIATPLIVVIDNMLGPSKRRIWGTLLAVMVTCAEPAVLVRLSWPEGLAVVLPASLITIVLLCLRDRGGDPNRQSWMPALSRALEPSLSNQISAGLLAALILLVTCIGSSVAGFCVAHAGQHCGEVDVNHRSDRTKF